MYMELVNLNAQKKKKNDAKGTYVLYFELQGVRTRSGRVRIRAFTRYGFDGSIIFKF